MWSARTRSPLSTTEIAVAVAASAAQDKGEAEAKEAEAARVLAENAQLTVRLLGARELLAKQADEALLGQAKLRRTITQNKQRTRAELVKAIHDAQKLRKLASRKAGTDFVPVL